MVKRTGAAAIAFGIPRLMETNSKGPDVSYYGRLRDEILRLVPPNARRVLSVGCGAGVTEGELVKKGVEVVGIEMNADAAHSARARGLMVIEGDAADVSQELENRCFDCLIYADVLEHIADPVAILRVHMPLLNNGGSVIISVPNFRHFSVVAQLFGRGHIRYTDAGILDRTHVRLTTRRMVQEWFAEVGLRPVAMVYRMSQRREKVLAHCSLGLLREFVARQVIVVAQKD